MTEPQSSELHGVSRAARGPRRTWRGEFGQSTTLRLAARVGVLSWSLIGLIIVSAIVLMALATVSELVLPLILAVMIGTVFYPAAQWLQRRGLPAGAAAGLVVLGIVAGLAALVFVIVRTMIAEVDAIADQVDQAWDALEPLALDAGLDPDNMGSLWETVSPMANVVAQGILSGVGALFTGIAGGILALLIMYYVLKDGPDIRQWFIEKVPAEARRDAEEFSAFAVTSIRAYWAGRSILSAAVTAVVAITSLIMGLPLVGTIAMVNFVGGFVPYIGAVIGGALPVLLALSNEGIASALIMLAIVVAANVLLENLLEPRIMAGRLSIHPLVVLVSTTAGGLIGGIFGLILAVPTVVLGMDVLGRVWRFAQSVDMDEVLDGDGGDDDDDDAPPLLRSGVARPGLGEVGGAGQGPTHLG